MKYAVLTIAYNEADNIKACIKNWSKFIDKHLVLVSNNPWNGTRERDDKTNTIASLLGAVVIVDDWKTEEDQRNCGLAYLSEYDYVFIIDADELYLEEDIIKMISIVEKTKREAYGIHDIITYWKTTDYILSPPDSFNDPVIVVSPRKVKFSKYRSIVDIDTNELYFPWLLPIVMHHLSWVKSDIKAKEKIQTYGHAKDFHKDWYNNE